MTAYRNGKAFAHVMEWSGDRKQWQPLCSRASLNIRPVDWYERDCFPLYFVGLHDRLLPWCSQCVRAAQRKVDLLVADVLGADE